MRGAVRKGGPYRDSHCFKSPDPFPALQAFWAAGACRVVASHWSVSDESTAELVAGFFELIATDDLT